MHKLIVANYKMNGNKEFFQTIQKNIEKSKKKRGFSQGRRQWAFDGYAACANIIRFTTLFAVSIFLVSRMWV